ncbi:MAG: sulfite exporter TauE/SafE family protein [Marinilabiliales bacterium]|nr:sulfite exporter TauE/SafE family protein [Marinilabiliales bacterium]
MSILITALVLGLMGSLHCVGMCGPLALSLPLRGDRTMQKILGSMLWSLGRIVTYGIMGALFGAIGSGFKMLGYQQAISVILGVTMILFALLPSLFNRMTFQPLQKIFQPMRLGMQRLLREKNRRALFILGLFNGLLPCGLVYMAIAGALGTGDFYLSIAYMALFGLGTLPLLLVVSMLGNVISVTLRNQINKWVPVVIVMIGLIFVLRGLSLGIPYLSPPKEKLIPVRQMNIDKMPSAETVKHSCCEHDSTATH